MILLTDKLGKNGDFYVHWCPGCNSRHMIPVVADPEYKPNWTFNNNVESPSFQPSIHFVGRCHYFIVNGQIQFCGDSRHALAGQTVLLPDFPEHILVSNRSPQ